MTLDNQQLLHLGVDIGSTTIKLVVLDDEKQIRYKRYMRHLSNIKESVIKLIDDAYVAFPQAHITVRVAGSAGISIAEWLAIPFVQEVIASTKAIETFASRTDVAIELG
ncbi:MAG TPA: hypothetical protein PLG43_09335, partial [Spirochaetia bacterium]|nr:hypothetical protein [Spirochaetia bacterium]